MTMVHNFEGVYNNVKFVCFALLAVSEEAETWLHFFFSFDVLSELSDSVYVIRSRMIKVSVRVISQSLWIRLITLPQS